MERWWADVKAFDDGPDGGEEKNLGSYAGRGIQVQFYFGEAAESLMARRGCWDFAGGPS